MNKKATQGGKAMGMENLLDYLDMLEDILDNSKSVPFSSRVSVDKEQLFDILSEMRLNLPNEVRQAQRIIEDHDKILQDAKNKAANILKEAEIRAQEHTDDHVVYKMAVEQAQELMEETKRSAKDMRLGAIDYVDDLLSKAENTIRESLNNLNQHYRTIEDEFSETIETIYTNRQEMRGNNNK